MLRDRCLLCRTERRNPGLRVSIAEKVVEVEREPISEMVDGVESGSLSVRPAMVSCDEVMVMVMMTVMMTPAPGLLSRFRALLERCSRQLLAFKVSVRQTARPSSFQFLKTPVFFKEKDHRSITNRARAGRDRNKSESLRKRQEKLRCNFLFSCRAMT